MVGVERLVFGIYHTLVAAGLGVGIFKHPHVIGEALKHQGYAAVMEQSQGIGLIHRLRADALGQGQAGHGHILRGIPETVEGDDGVVAHLTFDRLGVDQVDNRTTAEQVHRTLD
ncbi:hypothetical protein D3C79_765910 [compost metagenome]